MFEKEVTDLCCSTCNAEVSCYEDWKKNPTPRVMWVWDDNAEKE